MTTPRTAAALIALASLFAGPSCAETPPTRPAPTATAPAPAAPGAPAQLEIDGAHAVWRLSDRVLSGSVPEGDAAFAALASLGVRTVLSVDGARPDLDAMRRHGLRSIHLPVGYDGIERARAVEIVRAVEESPGPVYVHCHHGRHRGPTAAAIALIAVEGWSAERAVAQMRAIGTSSQYVGLYDVVARFDAPTARERATARSAPLPAVAAVPPMAAAMVGIDHGKSNLDDVRAADWGVPSNHPDVDPAHEALKLRELFVELGRSDGVADEPLAFRRRLGDAARAAGELEAALRAGDRDAAERAHAAIDAACRGCHAAFRDVPTD